MTIAMSLKVNDGVVLAADSASTLLSPDNTVFNVYNNANKIVNLVKGLPIGVVTWGAGAIGAASMETLYKDLRRRLAGQDPRYPDWGLNAENYSLDEVAKTTRKFLYEEHYLPAYRDWEVKPQLGCLVAAYSTTGEMAEGYELSFRENGDCPEPVLVQPAEECGIYCNGQPAAVWRLLLGFDPQLTQVLEHHLKVPPDDVQLAMQVIQRELQASLLQPAMPIQDAIDLAEFLVDVAEKYSRFSLGAETVGGPIEVAAITKHEHFKWIRRKYFYRREMNPEEGAHVRPNRLP